MEEKSKRKKNQQHTSFALKNANDVVVPPITTSKVLLVHLGCGLGLASAFWIAHNLYSFDLTNNPSDTLRLIWYFKAVFRGFFGLPAGAVINAFGAIVLGAPGIQHFSWTVHWSLLMSVLTFVPAASVFGSSRADWHRIFAHTKPVGPRDYMISLPAHGAVIGAWFGAWPMPLDWERPWQEWPICVSFGALAGYLIGMVASLGFTLYHNRQQHVKGE